MKTTLLTATAVFGVTLAAAATAHHNSPFGTELEIGDMMGRHEAAIENLNLDGAMDPSNDAPTDSSDGSMPEDLDPQPTGIRIPRADPGTDNGGTTDGVPW